jgi:hypothetical protein
VAGETINIYTIDLWVILTKKNLGLENTSIPQSIRYLIEGEDDLQRFLDNVNNSSCETKLSHEDDDKGMWMDDRGKR